MSGAGGTAGGRSEATSGAGGPAGRQAGRRRRVGLRSGRVAQAEAPGHPEDPLGDPDEVAQAICLRLLGAAPRTRAELARALARRGVPDESATRVLGRFTEVGLVDDRTFAAAWVSSRHAGRGLGRRALSSELRRRGVEGRTVADAVSALDPETESETARRLVRRRLAATARLEPAAKARRLTGMLARKGYSPEVALRIVREEIAADAAASEALVGVDEDDLATEAETPDEPD